mgnify:FL=1
MRQTKLFTKTKKETPADEVAKNAKLLIQAGFIHKEMAGVYSYLPLGLRVLENINRIIREEMKTIGGQEIQMTALQNPEIWKKTDRWEQDVWFKTSLKAGGEVGFGWTQEEAVTRIASQYVSSYRDLPFSAFQIQTKFRNEERAKSGIMRGREFLMKDLYSFHRDQSDLDKFYETATEAYKRVFKRLGLGNETYVTFASGGAFSKYSHEFQTVSESGEDTIHVSKKKNIAINKDVLSDEVLADLGLKRDELEEKKAIEVGNIFKLGTRFSEPLGLFYADEKGEKRPVVMGCYGIGPSRLMGTIVEVMADEKGIVWPLSIAPFKVHLLSLGKGAEISIEADKIYDELQKAGIDTLYDDREVSAGEKFADADLLGIPYRLVVSSKSLKEGGVEIKKRTEEGAKIISLKEAIKLFS